jgi:hypothetical protein
MYENEWSRKNLNWTTQWKYISISLSYYLARKRKYWKLKRIWTINRVMIIFEILHKYMEWVNANKLYNVISLEE